MADRRALRLLLQFLKATKIENRKKAREKKVEFVK